MAGCGSSGGSGTISIGNENSADNALVTAGENKVAKTPTTGPLSKEPTIVPPKGPAPKTLEIKNLITGEGGEAVDGKTLTVNYVGVLYKTGKIFDASWKRKEPFVFTLGKKQVIAGWEKGLLGMHIGGRRELIIPASEAYGATGSPPTIPANETLIFDIDLLGN
jgi:peptidylprolyl isomerase